MPSLAILVPLLREGEEQPPPPDAPRTVRVERSFNVLQAVVPSNTTDLAELADALYVGGGGAVVVVAEDGSATTWTVPNGAILPIRVRRVNQTGTTATGIIALYRT